MSGPFSLHTVPPLLTEFSSSDTFPNALLSRPISAIIQTSPHQLRVVPAPPMGDPMITIPTSLWHPPIIPAPQQLSKAGNLLWADVCKDETLLPPLAVLPPVSESLDPMDPDNVILPTSHPITEFTKIIDPADTIEPLAANFIGWHLSLKFSSILDTVAPLVPDDWDAVEIMLDQQEVGLTLKSLLDTRMLLYFTE